MTILSYEQIDRLRLADQDHKTAANEFVAECRLFFQPGVVIYWRNRGHLQSGIVQVWSGTAHYPDIRVQNDRTGNVVSVSFHSIDWERMISQFKTYEQLLNTIEAVKA
jgi:hypothetical protein